MVYASFSFAQKYNVIVLVSSSGVHTKEAKGLHEVMDRAYKNKDYYKNNPMLKSTFDFDSIIYC
ncbi:MAG: hypothetical protein J6O61_07110 [Butyrivibrio sp.]|uniref:hypothetical protein n=1 Tax=Butyrivibrio sp. TaxID=28121 RepID=UPI001B125068|nr:hypothetical protein [Butyrivibrio sp.]MBO6240585.1 hypothetical protein [Butyrivibrio sp.]